MKSDECSGDKANDTPKRSGEYKLTDNVLVVYHFGGTSSCGRLVHAELLFFPKFERVKSYRLDFQNTPQRLDLDNDSFLCVRASNSPFLTIKRHNWKA
ncbi:hypothetical protein RYZ26_16215 [Terasakiella sp. A23]|uniref:hypothetical protein n=1 Tax=Terasakiella sp. FCG-A23 TaxID=3080561 RepID=UPI0029539AD8|nr:hypothetical protein [Terasakiella sp. A23]MDV7341153.1 hypothetical protein [Terasakiella sp. A23]